MKFEAAKKVIIIIDIILEWVSYARRAAFFSTSLSCFLVMMAEKADALRGTKNINVKRLYQTCHSIDTFAFPIAMLIIISYFLVVVWVNCVVPFCKKRAQTWPFRQTQCAHMPPFSVDGRADTLRLCSFQSLVFFISTVPFYSFLIFHIIFCV